MDPITLGIGLVALFCGIGVVSGVRSHQRRFDARVRALAEETGPYDDVAVFTRGGTFGLCTTSNPRVEQLLGPLGGPYGVQVGPHAGFTAHLHGLCRRTTFELSRRGWRGGSPARRRCLADVGDARFEDAFCVTGSNEDVLRAVCQRMEVQDAVYALFVDPDALSVVLFEDGRAVCTFVQGLDGVAINRQRMLRFARLVRELELAADAEPVASTTSPLRSSVGAASGAPIGVSILDRDR